MIQSIIEGAPQSARVVVVGRAWKRTGEFPCTLGLKSCPALRTGVDDSRVTKALELIASGAVNVSPMVTGKVGIGEVAGGFAELANPNRHAKILVEPWRA